MHPSQSAGPRVPGVLTALALLWLAGAAMRLPILAVPPVIRLIHDDLHMSETQVGLLIGIFAKGGAYFATVLTGVVLGVLFGAVWALIGYLATRGQRDFSSISKVIPSRYEVLTEHNLLAQGQELLAKLPINPASL